MSAAKITGRLLILAVLLIVNFVAYNQFTELLTAADGIRNGMAIIILVGLIAIDVFTITTIWKKWL